MTEQTIGILGGMGPAATAFCFAEIVANTPACRDQDHLRVVMDSNPKTPDRSAAILGQGPSPLPMLRQGCENLARAGADFVIIPCISAHFWFKDLARVSPLPLLCVFDAVAEAIRRRHPGMDAVGLVGTTGTVRSGLFQKRLEEAGIKALVPSRQDQERVMRALYDIKGGTRGADQARGAVAAELIRISGTLLGAGARGIVAACTETPLILHSEDLPCPYFNSLRILARAAIRRAGRDPVA